MKFRYEITYRHKNDLVSFKGEYKVKFINAKSKEDAKIKFEKQNPDYVVICIF